MEKTTFKMPVYWGGLWDTLSTAEVGKIVKSIFLYAFNDIEQYPDGIGKEATDILERCFDDIRYQKAHPRSYRKPQNVREIRNSAPYKEWRAAVFERDGYRCQNCGKVGGTLNAHHIKPFARYPSLRFDVNNGITLCTECHKLAHARGFRNA